MYGYLQKDDRQITVIGERKVYVQPNLATIQLGVLTLEQQATVAEEKNAEIVTDVIEGIKALGIKEEALRTVLFQITPRYEYVQNELHFIGYEVTNVLQVTLYDFSLFSSVIDTSVQRGVNQIGMLQFTYDQSSQLKQQALQRAISDAKDKVLAIAKNFPIRFNPHR